MTPTQIAQEVVDSILQEDRVDDLLSKYPQLGLDRHTLEQWKRFDPTGDRAKYLPWMVKQVADGKLKMPQDSDHLRDQLREYERLVTIPNFEGSRDIQTFDWPQLDEIVTSNLELRSRSDQERSARQAKKQGMSAEGSMSGVQEIAREGNISVLEIKDAVALSTWGWKAYGKDNPNWEGTPLTPPPPGAEESLRDGLWCIRYPTYGTGYIKREPTDAFYMVLKNGGPYVGILLKDGQAKTLQNKSLTMGMAEEIYPAMKGILSMAKDKGIGLTDELAVFNNLRFITGEVQSGETFSGDMDLSGSSVKELPEGLTFERSLNISNTRITAIPANTTVKHNLNAKGSALTVIDPSAKLLGSIDIAGTGITQLPDEMSVNNLDITNTAIAQLPIGLKIKGQLHMEGTQISKFPDDLEISDDTVTWSEPMTRDEIKRLFFIKTLPNMRLNFEREPKIAGLGPKDVEVQWKKFKKELWGHFATSDDVERYVDTMFVHKEPERK